MIKSSAPKRLTAAVVIAAFLVFIGSDILLYSQETDQSRALQLIEDGKRLYMNGERDRAIARFLEAKEVAQTREEFSQIYLNLALAYYATGDKDSCQANLLKLFEIQMAVAINEMEFPPGFIEMFRTAKEDMAAKVAEQEKEKDKEEIALVPAWKSREGEKKEKKFPWLILVGGIAVVGVIVALLLAKTGKNTTTSSTTSVASTTTTTSAPSTTTTTTPSTTTTTTTTVSPTTSTTTTSTPSTGLQAPSNLLAVAVSSSRIDLSWTDNSGNESGFKIERKRGAERDWEDLAQVGANVTSYQDTGLDDGREYFYRVRAFNSSGDSPYSNEAGATTTATPTTTTTSTTTTTVPTTTTTSTTTTSTPSTSTTTTTTTSTPTTTTTTTTSTTTTVPSGPVAPSNLTVETVSSDQIDISWQDNSNDETGFKLERKAAAADPYVEIAVLGPNVTSYQDSGLAPSFRYYYRVRAYNASGNSAYSNEARTPVIAAPTNLQAAAASASQINLTWTDNSSIEEGYRIERKLGPAGSWSQVATVGKNVSSYSDTGLSSGTQYCYRVRAYWDLEGVDVFSDYSNEVCATTSVPAFAQSNPH